MEQDFQRTFAPLSDEERHAHLQKIQADTLAVTATARKQEIDNEARELKALEAYSVIAHNSGMFGTQSPEQAGAVMLIAKAFNIPPILAFQQFDIIENKPAMKAVAMMARFQHAGGSIEYQSYTDENVTATFVHPDCPKPITIVASWEDCKGLSGEKIVGFKNRSFTKTRDGGVKKNWADSRRSMLRSRAVSEGIRATLPGVLMGMYSPEEVEEMQGRAGRYAVSEEDVQRPSAPNSLKDMARKAVEASRSDVPLDPGDPLAPFDAELAKCPTQDAAMAIQARWLETADESIVGEIRKRTTARLAALAQK